MHITILSSSHYNPIKHESLLPEGDVDPQSDLQHYTLKPTQMRFLREANRQKHRFQCTFMLVYVCVSIKYNGIHPMKLYVYVYVYVSLYTYMCVCVCG